LLGWADSLEGLKQEVASVSAIKADFIQEKHLRMLDAPLISKGRLYFETPQSLRWEYRSPVRSILLMKDKTIRRYVEGDKGLVEQGSQGLEAMRVFLREICLWMQGEFEGNPDFRTELKSDRTVVLTPDKKAIAEVVERIELKLTDTPGVIQTATIYEDADTYTRIRFTDTKINQPIKDRVFEKAMIDANGNH
jgi:outer membrane lipoprotein-sorting protein